MFTMCFKSHPVSFVSIWSPNNIGRRIKNYEPLLWVRATAQAVSRRPFKTVAPVRSKAIPCGIYSGKRTKRTKTSPCQCHDNVLIIDALCCLFIVQFLKPPVMSSLLFKHCNLGLYFWRNIVKGTENAVVRFLIQIVIQNIKPNETRKVFFPGN
jgi:hypothetical protein